MDKLDRQVVTMAIVGCSVFYTLFALGNVLSGNNKEKQVNKGEMQRAEVIGFDDMAVLLNTDKNKQTAEARCSFVYSEMSHEDMTKLFPKGTSRTVWEWERLGQYSKIESR